MNFCYCIGGTGARIAEVAAFLTSMNMGTDDKIEFIIVDKDKKCGGTKHATDTINQVQKLVERNSPSALNRSTKFGDSSRKFCKAELIRGAWDFTAALNQMAGGDAEKITLKNAVVRAGSDDSLLLDAFYSTEEQNKTTEGGFHGHPSIGALLLQYTTKSLQWDQNNSANDIVNPVRTELYNGRDVNVFIIGSIFGGTGASVYSNLAARLRACAQSPQAKGNLLISGVLLLPYFAMGDPTTDEDRNDPLRIEQTKFYANSRVALEQYGDDPNLMRSQTNPNGSFDTLYLCGQDPLHVTGVYASSGSRQKNHFDLVDLVAARAMTEFFVAAAAPGNTVGAAGTVYEYRFDAAKDPAQIKEAEILEMTQGLYAMLAFSAFVICKVYIPLLVFQNNDKKVPVLWIKTLYSGKEIKKLIKHYRLTTDGENVFNKAREYLSTITEYCKRFLEFVHDIAMNGFDWGAGDGNVRIGDGRSYQLFNTTFIEALLEIYNASENPQGAEALTDRFIKGDTCQEYSSGGSQRLSPAAVSDELYNLTFNRITYDDAETIEMRLADYLHEAYAYCEKKA